MKKKERKVEEKKWKAYNGIEESRFSDVGKTNDAGSEAHAYLRGREAPAAAENAGKERVSGKKRLFCEEAQLQSGD